MNKPASELIALADRLESQKSPYGDWRGYSLHYKERDAIVQALRNAANQSGSERAGVGACPHPIDMRFGSGGVSSDGSGYSEWRCVKCGHHERIDFPPHATPPAQPAPAATHDGAVREALRAICKAGNELGCSCADRNYQWFDQSCKELMADAFRKMLADEAALSPKTAAAETSPGDAYREVIDEGLIARHLGVAKGNAKAELNQILDWDVAAALDPAVSGRKA